MKVTNQQLRDAVITMGKALGMNTIELLVENVGIYSTIKEITYNMFVNNYVDYFENDDEIYNAIQLVREYTIEMKKNGFVEFNN